MNKDRKNEFGGSMPQFQGDAYKAFLAAEQQNDPIIQQAKAAGPEFWEQTFARLTGQ